MAIKATLPSTFARFNDLAAQMRRDSLASIATLASGSVNSSYILEVLSRLRAIKQEMSDIAATPGIVAFAQNSVGGSYDVAVEFVAMDTELDAVITWIVTNIPKTAGNKLAVETINLTTGAITEDQFTEVQTAGLQTALQNLADTIE